MKQCPKCNAEMEWVWGGPITYFECVKCGEREPCPNIIIEGGKVTKEDGNKKEVLLKSKENSATILRKILE